MTTYLTTIGTRISKRSLFYKLITGCGPVGRALDLGSRRREFESPHSDHKNRCFRLKTAVFNTFMHILFEPLASGALHQKCIMKISFLCLLHTKFRLPENKYGSVNFYGLPPWHWGHFLCHMSVPFALYL